MTIDEAIRELKQFSGTTRLRLSANFWKALNMAIKALDQESCEDAVSRKTVLNTLNRMDSVLDENRTVETYKELLIACYNDLPPVTPVPQGKWIKRESITGLEQYYECSNCGNHCLYEYVEIGFQNAKTKYCPNCGAEMESEK